MKDVLFVFANNLVPLSSVICAAFLMYYEKSGWGWLILIAIGSCTTYEL